MSDKKSYLGTEKITTLMLKLSIPSILAYFINILYNIVDRIYIGHIQDSSASNSALALTGLGLCLPILQLITAFSAFAGAGGAPLAAIELGKSEFDPQAKERAHQILGNAVLMLLSFSVCLTTLLLLNKTRILNAFGASENTLPYAESYLSVYLTGTIFVQLALGLNPFITCQGRAKTAMLSICIGAVLNILLDPVFIFVLKLGVTGAAFATIISQFFSALWIVCFLTSKKSALQLSFKILQVRPQIIKRIAGLGLSPFVMQSTESAIFVVFNSGLQKYGGDLYVGAMTIMQSIMQMSSVIIHGFSAGVQPIISYNFGAQKTARVKETVKHMLFTNGFIALITVSSVSFFPGIFAGLFTANFQLIEIVKRLMPFYVAGMWLMWAQNTAQNTFVGLGKSKVSIFIACLRKIILLIPLAFILPIFFGVEGIFFAEPIATTCSAITSCILLYKTMKKLS